MTATFPARVHVVLARNASTGVVIRRGPSKQVATFLWDRNRDLFSLGQWLKGRIYERRCDVSADGRHFIYFAMNGKWDSDVGGSWTAISQTPWLKAISLYAKGDCLEGGGLFLDDSRFWLNDRYFSPDRVRIEARALKRDPAYQPPEHYGSECTGVYYHRLQRDGWRMLGSVVNGRWSRQSCFEKELPNGQLLRKIAHAQTGSPPGKGCYWDEHELVDAEGTVTQLPAWEWAELDRGRLVWAERGVLYASPLASGRSALKPSPLHDFNAYQFEAIEAPY